MAIILNGWCIIYISILDRRQIKQTRLHESSIDYIDYYSYKKMIIREVHEGNICSICFRLVLWKSMLRFIWMVRWSFCFVCGFMSITSALINFTQFRKPQFKSLTSINRWRNINEVAVIDVDLRLKLLKRSSIRNKFKYNVRNASRLASLSTAVYTYIKSKYPMRISRAFTVTELVKFSVHC